MTTQQPQDPHSTTNPDVSSQLASIDQRLLGLEAMHTKNSTDYAEAHSKYLKELDGYAAERAESGRFRLISLILRVVSVIVLIYIAYRVS
jgi:hypothetical protein